MSGLCRRVERAEGNSPHIGQLCGCGPDICDLGFTWVTPPATSGPIGHPNVLRDAAVSQIDDLRKVDPALAEWWLRMAAGDAVKTAPKASEYGGAGGGSADLRVMGYALAELAGMHEAPEAVKMEMACWFYALGKIARLISDYQQGQPGKPDTWFDLGIYTVMARRLQETGVWP